MVRAFMYLFKSIGFIAMEQSGLLTLPRATDESFKVMLDALFVAIEYIGKDE